MDIIFIKEYLTYQIDTVLKNADDKTAKRLISLGVCKENKKKKTVKKQLEIKTT